MIDLDKQAWWLRFFTLPLAGAYAVAIVVRGLCYRFGIFRRQKLPVPVVSIGNIAVGGTGKSPVVMALAKELIKAGKRPGILTRGYGRKAGKCDALILVAGKILHDNAPLLFPGDEALMESVMLPTVPVVQCRSRYYGGRFAADEGINVDVWLLDDGFQHWALHRDYDVVLLDGDDVGKRWLMPAGRLREPPSALSRADFLLFTRSDGSARWPNLIKKTATATFHVGWPTAIDGQAMPRELHPALVSGIARPARLITDLKELGCHVSAEYLVPDHAALKLPAAEVPIVTTAKDYYRNPSIFTERQAFIVPLAVRLPNALTSDVLRVVFP